MEDGKCVFGWAESSFIVGDQHLKLKIKIAKTRDKNIVFKDTEIIVKLMCFLIVEKKMVTSEEQESGNEKRAVFFMLRCIEYVQICDL